VTVRPGGAKCGNSTLPPAREIDTATNTVSATIPVGGGPFGVAVSPDGSKVYVGNSSFPSNTVSVIDTATNTVSATIPDDFFPEGVAVSPDGSKVYVTHLSGRVSVIDTAANIVIATIPIPFPALDPIGVAVSPDGRKVYVANNASFFPPTTVSVIDTATNTVIATIPVGFAAAAFGVFIRPPSPPSFAGVAGSANCLGTSVSALATKFGGLDAAAAALGFSNVQALQDAIRAFCAG
jgi:YVTN family beta-propeller protein